MARWLRILGVGLLAGCGAQDLLDLVNDIGNGSGTGADPAVQCARQDFGLLKPLVVSLLDAALGDDPGPVHVSVAVPGGRLMDIEITGVDGGGLSVGVPLPVSFVWSIDGGFEDSGDLTITLESDGMIRVAGDLRLQDACQLFVLDDLDLRVDPDDLPEFRPAGVADVESIADGALAVLTGAVTFDGAGKAVVDAIVTGPAGPVSADFSVSLN